MNDEHDAYVTEALNMWHRNMRLPTQNATGGNQEAPSTAVKRSTWFELVRRADLLADDIEQQAGGDLWAQHYARQIRRAARDALGITE